MYIYIIYYIIHTYYIHIYTYIYICYIYMYIYICIFVYFQIGQIFKEVNLAGSLKSKTRRQFLQSYTIIKCIRVILIVL